MLVVLGLLAFIGCVVVYALVVRFNVCFMSYYDCFCVDMIVVYVLLRLFCYWCWFCGVVFYGVPAGVYTLVLHSFGCWVFVFVFRFL